MPKTYDVIIAGAGPVGLFLASELSLSRLSVLVLEKEPQPNPTLKALPLGLRGLNALAMEAFYRRGLHDQLSESHISTPPRHDGKKPGFQFGGHFAGMGLNANQLDLSRKKWRLPGPALYPVRTNMQRLEAILGERAADSGVEIRRGDGIVALKDEERSRHVEVTTASGSTLRSRWLVGCDGGRSTVRKAVGIPFEGTDARMSGYNAKCNLDHPERLKPGFNPTGNGMFMNNKNMLGVMDPDGGRFDRSQKVTQEHLQTVFERVSGRDDVKIRDVEAVTTWTDACRLAKHYRKGRVLLAGDAAHIHSPMGAQGLNTGIGDAMNLGWKLAAIVKHEKSTTPGGPSDRLDRRKAEALLESYEAERRPEGARVLEWTRAQVLALEPGLFGQAMRKLLADLFATDDGANLMLDRVWGLSQKYDMISADGQAHDLVGRSLPDFELPDGTRIGEHMHGGKAMVLNFRGDPAVEEAVKGRADAVQHVAVRPNDTLGLSAVLARPDGVVVWVAEESSQPDLGKLKEALDKWFPF